MWEICFHGKYSISHQMSGGMEENCDECFGLTINNINELHIMEDK